jgi:prepilin-type N-terminal cleavage/methylation domain-containing protein
MFIKRHKKSRRGFTLVEFMVATCLFGLASMAVMTFYMYSTRAFASLTSYSELDKINRNAMDTLTAEIRQAIRVTDVTSNSVTMINGDMQSVTYRFDTVNRALVRIVNGAPQKLITDCTLLNFDVFQRNNIAGTWNQYPVATNDWAQYVKVIQLRWKTYRAVPGGPGVSENVQTAKIVIRKQH